MANQYLSLGLFIMLLSFFMVLNSMSTFEDQKVLTVVDSLSNALMPHYSLDDRSVSKKLASEGSGKRSGDALDDVQALFRSVIPDVYAQKNRFGNMLRVAMSRAEFEQALAGQGDNGERFALMLVGLMSMPERAKYQVEILLSSDVNPLKLSEENPEKMQDLSRAAAGYAQVLEETGGVDPKYVSSGLVHDKPDMVFLVFKKYTPIQLTPIDVEMSN